MDFDREMLYSSVRNTLYQGSSNNLKSKWSCKLRDLLSVHD